jgi:hypothetical protein
MRRVGLVLLGIWLILVSLLPLLNVSFPGSNIVLGILALAAGILLLLEGDRPRMTRNIGFVLLSIWLILWGLFTLLGVAFPGSDILLGILGVAAGIFILIAR